MEGSQTPAPTVQPQMAPPPIIQTPTVQPQEPGFEQVTKSVKFPISNNYRRFNTLFVLPKEASYENLEKDERVILFIYKHMMTLIPRILLGILFVCALVAGLILLFIFSPDPFVTKTGIIVAWLWASFVLLYFLMILTSYRSDVYIVTNERIIDFDVVNLLYKNAQDIDLESIHSIQNESGGGIVRGMFDYGNVTIDYTGGEFILHNVTMPSKIALAIGELAEARRESEKQQVVIQKI